jgi:K+-sensing histidine kinase KdpD
MPTSSMPYAPRVLAAISETGSASQSQAHTASSWASALDTASRQLIAASDHAAIADALLPACLDILHAAGAMLAVVAPEQQRLVLAGAAALPSPLLLALLPSISIASTPLVDALQQSEPCWFGSREQIIGDYPHLAPALEESELERWVFVPLRVDAEGLGVLAVAFTRSHSIQPEHAPLLPTLSALAAQALARLRNLASMQQHKARIQALTEASQAFGQAGQDLETVLQQVTRRVSELVGGACGVRLLDSDGLHLQLAALYHPDQELAAGAWELLTANPQRVDEGLAAAVLSRGEPVLLTTIDQAALRAGLRPAFHAHLERWPISSLLTLPLRTRSGMLGLLSMTRYADEMPYTLDDQSFLVELADRAALAIANAQLFASAMSTRTIAEQAAAHTLRLQTVTAAVAEALTPDEVLAIIADQVKQLVGDASGIIGLVTDDGQALELVQTIGYAPGDLRPWQRLPLDAAQPGSDVVRSGAAQFCESREALVARYPHLAQAALKSEAWAIVPLRAEGRTLGILSLGFPQPRMFDPDERGLLEFLARQCATAMQRTARFREVEQARTLAEQVAQRTARLYALSTALASVRTLSQVTDVIVREGMAALGATAVAIYQIREDARTLVALGVAGYPEQLAEQWRTIPLDLAVPMAEVARSGAPVFVDSAASLAARWPLTAPVMELLGDQSFAFMPLLARDKLIGVAGFAFAPPRSFTAEEREFLVALGAQCSQAMDRARLLAAEQRAREHLAFLSEASTQLIASLDYNETLRQIVRLCVPRLADWCAVEIPSPDGRLELAAIAHTDPAKEQWARELREHHPATMDMPVGSPLVIRSGEPLFYPDVSDEMLQQAASDPEELRLLRLVGYRSMIVVPLRARERIIGALGLISTADSGRVYNSDDVDLAAEFARRAGVALDNARLYQEAQEAIQIRNQFLSIAAHELKTPLTALSGQAQLVQRRMSRGEQTPERLGRSLAIIGQQAERLDTMVGTLLDVGRLERGQFVLEQQTLDLVGLVGRVVDEVRPDLDHHTLVYEHGVDPILVNGDSLRLEQVVHNLVNNAVKYSPAGGTIMVRVERQAEAALLTVSDEGLGIPAGDLPQLFQQFYRADNVAAHHISGMGIGLYVVREIVTKHNGTVDVTSIEGVGSTFTVRLPLAMIV